MAPRSKQSSGEKLKALLAPAFVHFTRLPQEIQNVIWQCAIDNIGPRVVEIKARSYMKTRRRRHVQAGPIEWISTCPIPSVLHACRNSRDMAMGRWRLFFELAGLDDPPRIFFDFFTDILYFGKDSGSIATYTDTCWWDEAERVRKLAFHVEYQHELRWFGDGWDMAMNFNRSFSSLTHLFFVERELFCSLEYNHEVNGLLQSIPDPSKTVITFSSQLYEDLEEQDYYILEDLRDPVPAIEGWTCPKIKRVCYERTDADAPGLMCLPDIFKEDGSDETLIMRADFVDDGPRRDIIDALAWWKEKSERQKSLHPSVITVLHDTPDESSPKDC